MLEGQGACDHAVLLDEATFLLVFFHVLIRRQSVRKQCLCETTSAPVLLSLDISWHYTITGQQSCAHGSVSNGEGENSLGYVVKRS